MSHINEMLQNYHKRQIRLSHRIIYAADNLVKFL